MFERIVAAIDDDAFRRKRVIQATTELATARSSAVTVAHILELEQPVAATGRPTTVTMSLKFEDEGTARALVEEALTTLHEAGVNARGVVRSGGGSSTAKELLSVANEAEADLIVVGDRGSHLSDLLLGGVAHRIVHAARCPVLLVR